MGEITLQVNEMPHWFVFIGFLWLALVFWVFIYAPWAIKQEELRRKKAKEISQ